MHHERLTESVTVARISTRTVHIAVFSFLTGPCVRALERYSPKYLSTRENQNHHGDKETGQSPTHGPSYTNSLAKLRRRTKPSHTRKRQHYTAVNPVRRAYSHSKENNNTTHARKKSREEKRRKRHGTGRYDIIPYQRRPKSKSSVGSLFHAGVLNFNRHVRQQLPWTTTAPGTS